MLLTLISLFLALTSQVNVKATGNVPVVLSTHTMSLDDRYGVKSVSDVFKDNILLTMAYMDGKVSSKANLDWQKVTAPFDWQFTLQPGEEFAFHDQTLAKYAKNIVMTTKSHYNYDEGFKSDGYLMGDGVCHLASLINWAAKDAGLEVVALRNHDFAHIPDVPKEYGVAIFTNPYAKEGGDTNLYITNNQDKPITFLFHYVDDNLTVAVLK